MDHRFIENWHWYEVGSDAQEKEFIKKKVHEWPACSEWLDNINQQQNNFLKIETEGDSPVLHGSLFYGKSGEEADDYQLFHFYVTNSYFATVGLDTNDLDRAKKDGMLEQMNRCKTAPEGFFVLIAEVLNNYLDGIDTFEYKLKDLQYNIRENNNQDLLDKIYERRQELLVWSDLTIPIEEIKLAAEEAFLDDITDTREYRRTSVRINRTLSLINHYKQDIDTMIKLEEVISSHRGNEIMKTLTVMTVIFTPGMMLGSIWGMNFKNMPELDWKMGYALALGLIGLSIVSIYLWLLMKGWTGDLLKSRNKKSRFK